jgi:fructokinase
MRIKSNRSGRCVGTGFIALDVIRSAVSDNTTLERRHAGGSCGNVLADLAFLGMHSSAVGRIGNDVAGGELLADLRRCGVDVTLLAVEEGRRTPVVIQETIVDARGGRRHRFSRACPVCGAAMAGYRPVLDSGIQDIATALPEHEVFFFDRVAPGTLTLARRSRELGALVVFEPSGVKDEALFVECLNVSHVFKYSHERLSGLEALVRRARPPLEIQTLGADGLRFRLRGTGGRPDWVSLEALPAPSVRDAAGSGDWCTAGLVLRMAQQGLTSLQRFKQDLVVAALQFGQALAALNCSYDGARGLMYAVTRGRALDAAERLIQKKRPRLPPIADANTSGIRNDRACTVCTSDLLQYHA